MHKNPILIVPSDHSYPQIDSEGFGEIPSCDFIAALRTLKFQSQVPMNKRELLLERALNGNGIVSFQDFVNVVSPPSFTKPTSCTLHINWLFIRFANNYRDPLQPHNRPRNHILLYYFYLNKFPHPLLLSLMQLKWSRGQLTGLSMGPKFNRISKDSRSQSITRKWFSPIWQYILPLRPSLGCGMPSQPLKDNQNES